MENNAKLFEGQNFYIGIDVHKKSWTVTIRNSEHEIKCFSQDPKPSQLVRFLQSHYPGGIFHIVYEAGFCGFEPYRYFLSQGMHPMITNPMDIPSLFKEKVLKSDKGDSRKLAKGLQAGILRGISVPTREEEADRRLTRQREQVVRDLASYKNRIKSFLMTLSIEIPEPIEATSRSWTKVYVNWLNQLEFRYSSDRLYLQNYMQSCHQLIEQVKTIDKQIAELVKKQRYSEDIELLRSVPGIGKVASMYVRTHFRNMSRFKRLDNLCGFVGIIPSTHSSGEKEVVGRMIKGGSPKLKSILIEASWVAVRKDPVLMKRFLTLKKRMHSNKAIVRIAKSLLSRIRHVLEHRELYQIGQN